MGLGNSLISPGARTPYLHGSDDVDFKKNVPDKDAAMRVRWWINLVVLCAIVTLVTSCEKEERKQEAPASYAAWVPPEQVPPALLRISERAEDVMVAAAGENWPRVLAYVRDITDAWRDYKNPTVEPVPAPRPPTTLLYGQMDTAVARLQEAAAARLATGTMRAANEVDAAAAELHEYYHPTVPTDLHRLRALEQRIALDAAENKTDGTAETLSRARRAWTQVRPVVEANSGPRAAAALDEMMASQQVALETGNSETLGIYARQAIDLIRDMERLSY
jgi:hypothetical protein